MSKARDVDLIKELAVCPACRGGLDWQLEAVVCHGCVRQFPIVDGIPILLLERELSHHDELEHINEEAHKRRQSAYFDQGDLAEFEVTRPRNAPLLYRWLLAEKSRRSLVGMGLLTDKTVLTVCGGSGMDADFLAQQGAEVIASDISLGAARRCLERARRFDLRIRPIVADVEKLPFRDKSIDLVYVHDGLHHLHHPLAGVEEMTRVASRGISITEPARAGATALAVCVGLAREYEEAGNRVARLRASDLEAALQSRGFTDIRASRYAMYYPHSPGAIFAALSRPIVFPLVIGLWRLANFGFGRFGNKLSVVATGRT